MHHAGWPKAYITVVTCCTSRANSKTRSAAVARLQGAAAAASHLQQCVRCLKQALLPQLLLCPEWDVGACQLSVQLGLMLQPWQHSRRQTSMLG